MPRGLMPGRIRSKSVSAGMEKFRVMGVSTPPGAMALTLTGVLISSMARALVSRATAPLVAP